MSSYYIATSLSRSADHNLIRDQLSACGWQITYDWTIHGSVKHDGVTRLSEVSELEIDGVRRSDVVIILLPGGRGTHAELGMAAVLQKPTYIHSFDGSHFELDERTCAFYWHSKAIHLTGPLGDVVEYDISRYRG